MKSYCIRFSEELETATNEHIRLAKRVWKAARPDPALPLRVPCGNYAGYGKYVARCHSSGVIEFPIGNRFSVVKLDGNEITYAVSPERFLGVLMHEVGHHVVNTARASPWALLSDGGRSTHLRKEWIWICQTAWSHFHEDVPAPNVIASVLRSPDARQRRPMVSALTRFSPFTPPPRVKAYAPECDHCGESLLGKRRGARYCSASCRTMASRSRGK